MLPALPLTGRAGSVVTARQTSAYGSSVCAAVTCGNTTSRPPVYINTVGTVRGIPQGDSVSRRGQWQVGEGRVVTVWGVSGTIIARCPQCAHQIDVDVAWFAAVHLNLFRRQLSIQVQPITLTHECTPVVPEFAS